jgi:hypothetical protein
VDLCHELMIYVPILLRLNIPSTILQPMPMWHVENWNLFFVKKMIFWQTWYGNDSVCFFQLFEVGYKHDRSKRNECDLAVNVMFVTETYSCHRTVLFQGYLWQFFLEFHFPQIEQWREKRWNFPNFKLPADPFQLPLKAVFLKISFLYSDEQNWVYGWVIFIWKSIPWALVNKILYKKYTSCSIHCIAYS